ncbi:MAG: hypothetical protein ABL897_06685 [Hyphomicrobium sp.]
MATLSILSLMSEAADELSLSRPASLVGNTTDSGAQKLLRHLTRTCRQLATRYDWQELRGEHTFTTVALADQITATPLPADFLRFVPETMFNRTKRYRVTMLTPEEWQGHQASLTTRVYDAYILRGNTILMAPTPAAGQTIAYEYVTRYVGYLADNSGYVSTFTNDTDIPILDDELLILGTVWRYAQSEGNDYAEQFREFEIRLNDLLKMNPGRRVIDMGGSSPDRIPVSPRVPETLVF